MSDGKPFPYKRAVQILAEAFSVGDKRAAEKYGVTTRTIGNYRSRLRTDPEFKSLYQFELSQISRGWHEARRRLLQKACERALELLPLCQDLGEISELLSKIGAVDSAAGALGLDRPASESPAEADVDAGTEQDDVIGDQRDYEDQAPAEDAGRVRAATPRKD